MLLKKQLYENCAISVMKKIDTLRECKKYMLKTRLKGSKKVGLINRIVHVFMGLRKHKTEE